MIEFIDRQVKEQSPEVYNTFSNQKVRENRMNPFSGPVRAEGIKIDQAAGQQDLPLRAGQVLELQG